MKYELLIVSQMPLREIWDEHGIVSENTICELSSSDVTDLLRAGRVRFVVADIGKPLQWIPPEECYEFWKSEAKTHIAEPEARNYLENFPGEYYYFASKWKTDKDEPIVLLAKSH